MIFDQLKEKSNLTATEQILADYILSHSDQIGEMSASELAKASFTSKSAVLRLCAKLGADGYRSFQHNLTVENLENKRIEKLLEKEPFHSGSTTSDIINRLPEFYDAAIAKTKQMLNKNTLRRAVNRLRHAEHIDIYGAGVTNTIAQNAAFKFRTIGIESQACGSMNEHYLFRTKNRNEKAAIILSLTGANESMAKAAVFMKQQGYYVLGIGGSDSDLLEKSSSDYVRLYHDDLIMSTEIITSVTVCNYVLDILFVSLLTEQYEKNTDASVKVYQLRH